jgi:hypothetical protein
MNAAINMMHVAANLYYFFHFFLLSLRPMLILKQDELANKKVSIKFFVRVVGC